jgi:tRNA modification GTPase
MYDVNDTIVAVSSPTCEQGVIIRISGTQTINICNSFFTRTDNQPVRHNQRKILTGSIKLDNELHLEAQLYLFPAPYSYTGDDIAEIHIYTNPAVTETLLQHLMQLGLRLAGPGEFTARAYLNGKVDLAQAEAVNEIIVSTNSMQLEAAQKLLSGHLSQTVKLLRIEIMDCLSLLEAGLDFSGEDIQFISMSDAVQKLRNIRRQLQELLDNSIYYESVLDMPAIGIAGVPNAGKSSLLNTLLGAERSIVSHRPKTTRDVLTGLLTLKHCKCVIFDCAGLLLKPETVIDELAQQSAIEALRNCFTVIFCIDISKDYWDEDVSVYNLIADKKPIMAATKTDLLSRAHLDVRLAELNKLFTKDFLPISANSGEGMGQLRHQLDSRLLKQTSQTFHNDRYEFSHSNLALTARHRQILTESITGLEDSIVHVQADNDEVAAMMLRVAFQNISSIEQHLGQPVDEQVLDQIFSRFCIGK